MKKSFLLSLLVVLSCCVVLASYAQQKQSLPKSKWSAIKAFIPKGYNVLDTVTGSLNGDAFSDVILILKNKAEDTTAWGGTKRPMLLLVGLPGGGYKLAARNDSVVYTNDLGGVKTSNPYTGTTIKHNGFTVGCYGGMGCFSWEKYVTFSYDSRLRNWYLTSITEEEYVIANDPNDTSDNISATNNEKVRTTKDFGKILFKDYKMSMTMGE